MTRIVCPGSFDPIHLGHLDVIRRAARLFDEVIVAVTVNPSKTPMFSLDQRLELIRLSCAELGAVRPEAFGGGLIAEFCREQGATALVKGLRHGGDLDYETPMAVMNRELTGVDTVYLGADPAHVHLSSSLVKEVFSLGAEIENFVPAPVAEALAARR
ncbi:MAG: pantetheine-phosphate adenylyltransferase [Micrococcus sp.]|nr:pantetheine-phosphate adenylyltransferase [Micrococcus sp.]